MVSVGRDFVGNLESPRVSSVRYGFLFCVTLSAALIGCGPGAQTETKSANSDSGTAASSQESKDPVKLLNVSYDPTRELWKELNQAFIPVYEKESGRKLTIEQSHGASGSQSRDIIDGKQADVATLSIWTDTDALRKNGLLK
jgi:sulfate transport system substrate-binding protein